ncbi:MAG: magnesium-translocating P-type ATPase [Chitinophagales bacterium]
MELSNTALYQSKEDLLLDTLQSGINGLSEEEAGERLVKYGYNKLKPATHQTTALLLIRQFKSPLTIILVASAILSFFLGERTDSLIILFIILVSAGLGFFQEKGAAGAVSKLLSLVRVDTRIIRDGKETSIPMDHVVPGDIVILSAGNIVPGDCRLLESKDLFINEASLTGETFPAEKKCGTLPQPVRMSERSNMLFMGTSVVSGSAKAVIAKTGIATEFGAISDHLRVLQPETAFEKGIRRFGYLLMEITLLLVLIVFAINIFMHKPVLDSFLFSLAIAVGLTPQLLPAIISINLAKGASNMAKLQVIVKKLSSIENLGSMNVLCADKTGTLTEGKVSLYKSVNYNGIENNKVFTMAYLNAFFETGFTNPIDSAIRDQPPPSMIGIQKLDEVPYDFIRKCLSIVVNDNSSHYIITKGAFDQIIAKCNVVEDEEGKLIPMPDLKEKLRLLYTGFCQKGYRILGIAYKPIPAEKLKMEKSDESEMRMLGLLLFTDSPKPDASATLQELKKLGINLKIITGDNALVAAHVSQQVGIDHPVILTGEQLRQMNSDALVNKVNHTDIFAAVEPSQKERILMALKRAGNTVGFIGDGINDAPALHAADVGISVNGAVDVAKEAADIVLLGNDLRVLINGVKEGRKTFANTMKYIFMATGANFGNMFSMAGSSLFLSFLPLLPKQVLLTNLLTDIPEMTIATDSVDDSMIDHPRKMNIVFIRKFMIVFGIISSIFDYLTFFVLLYWLRAGVDEFRTGWLLESVISASLIVLILRTSKPFYMSRPGKYLMIATFSVVAMTILLPYSPFAKALGLIPLPLSFNLWLALIIVFYGVTAELAKRIFYRNVLTDEQPVR